MEEGNKVKIYTELSATLSQISSSAATAVAPVLSELLLNQAQYKQRVEKTYAAIGSIWQEIFENILEDVDRAVDIRVDQVMAIARQEVHGRPILGVKRQRSSTGFHDGETGKRRQEGQTHNSSRMDNNRYSISHDDTGTSYKRPRVQRMRHVSILSSPKSERPVKEERDMNMESNALKEMQLKIEQQAKALESLSRENKEVRKCAKALIFILQKRARFILTVLLRQLKTTLQRESIGSPTSYRNA